MPPLPLHPRHPRSEPAATTRRRGASTLVLGVIDALQAKFLSRASHLHSALCGNQQHSKLYKAPVHLFKQARQMVLEDRIRGTQVITAILGMSAGEPVEESRRPRLTRKMIGNPLCRGLILQSCTGISWLQARLQGSGRIRRGKRGSSVWES